MKKIFLLVLCVVFLLSFTGCIEEKAPSKETAQIESEAEKAETVFVGVKFEVEKVSDEEETITTYIVL